MAKPNTILVKLVSTAKTGFYYVTKKNPRNTTEKLGVQEVRSGGAQTRAVQGSEDQVALRRPHPEKMGPESLLSHKRQRAGSVRHNEKTVNLNRP